MTFSELRATIAAEMPEGLHSHVYQLVYGVHKYKLDIEGFYYHRSIYADSPEALLAAWRELEGKLA